MMDPALERRVVPRLDGPFEAVVVWRGGALRAVEPAVAEDVSTRAVRLRLADGPVATGERVFVLVRLSPGGAAGPGVALRGQAGRHERRGDGTIALVMMVASHRWLFAPAVAASDPARPISSSGTG
jgi:hypothetical protein